MEDELRAENKQLRALVKRLVEANEILQKTYITTHEAAVYLGVKPRTIRKYNEEQRIEGRKFLKGNKLYFSLKEVNDFIDNNLVHAAFSE